MNKCEFLGRVATDIELKQTASGTSLCYFTVAVNRRFAKEGQQRTDFIRFVAFGKTAEFICKWFSKGQMIALCGELQINEYEKDGKKQSSASVAVSEVYFAGDINR